MPNCIKKGIRNGTQRYWCKHCSCNFQDNYSYKAYENSTNSLIKKLLKEGCGILSISRIIGILKNTVLSRMLKLSNQLKAPFFKGSGCTFEVDEMWTFIKSKDNCTWITYALERETKCVIDFFIGRKTMENIRPLVHKIVMLRPKHIYTDSLSIYPSLIPGNLHKRFQYGTNRIERMNLTLRTHIKRLSRKTICFSKSKVHLEAHLRIYFWG